MRLYQLALFGMLGANVLALSRLSNSSVHAHGQRSLLKRALSFHYGCTDEQEFQITKAIYTAMSALEHAVNALELLENYIDGSIDVLVASGGSEGSPTTEARLLTDYDVLRKHSHHLPSIITAYRRVYDQGLDTAVISTDREQRQKLLVNVNFLITLCQTLHEVLEDVYEEPLPDVPLVPEDTSESSADKQNAQYPLHVVCRLFPVEGGLGSDAPGSYIDPTKPSFMVNEDVFHNNLRSIPPRRFCVVVNNPSLEGHSSMWPYILVMNSHLLDRTSVRPSWNLTSLAKYRYSGIATQFVGLTLEKILLVNPALWMIGCLALNKELTRGFALETPYCPKKLNSWQCIVRNSRYEPEVAIYSDLAFATFVTMMFLDKTAWGSSAGNAISQKMDKADYESERLSLPFVLPPVPLFPTSLETGDVSMSG